MGFRSQPVKRLADKVDTKFGSLTVEPPSRQGTRQQVVVRLGGTMATKEWRSREAELRELMQQIHVGSVPNIGDGGAVLHGRLDDPAEVYNYALRWVALIAEHYPCRIARAHGAKSERRPVRRVPVSQEMADAERRRARIAAMRDKRAAWRT